MLNANFTSNDLAVHLIYDNDNLPENVEQVKKDIANYVSKNTRGDKR